MHSFLRHGLMIAWVLGLSSACTTTPPSPPSTRLPARTVPSIQPIEPAALPGWANDPLDHVVVALSRQCTLRTLASPWPRLCKELSTLPDEGKALRNWLESRFRAWPLRDRSGEDEGLITGYYEPLLTGSRTQESPSQVPLYTRPNDLLTIDLTDIEPRLQGMRLRGRIQGQKVVGYYSRSDIEQKRPLAGQELVWIDDRVDAFFLEIQGSGRVHLRDGTIMRVGYADQNGHLYRAIGRTLMERGAVKPYELTAPVIRRWLRENPQHMTEVLHSNPSMVFFRELPAPTASAPHQPELGPPGALGAPLTERRSLAVDRKVVPLGSLVWLDTRHPLDGMPLRRLMAAQDVGGAINGAVRADFFWGFGEEAERAAGEMKAAGRLWVLWPREDMFSNTPPTTNRQP
jgi:membrane-bound lytic murein transglycosylase A